MKARSPYYTGSIAAEAGATAVANIAADWRAGMSTFEIAMKRYRDREKEPVVAHILARLQDERHAARTLTTGGGHAAR